MYDEIVQMLRTEECLPFTALKIMKQAADAIEELSKPRWIPVTERLPKELERVLINDEDGVTIGLMDVFVGSEETYYEWHDTHFYRVFPTHWQPLPEPPKEEAT